jgi:hypothetical protein
MLIIESGHAAGQRWLLDRDLVIIGRAPKACDLVIPDREVSRRHAKIERTETGFVITDSGQEERHQRQRQLAERTAPATRWRSDYPGFQCQAGVRRQRRDRATECTFAQPGEAGLRRVAFTLTSKAGASSWPARRSFRRSRFNSIACWKCWWRRKEEWSPENKLLVTSGEAQITSPASRPLTP